MAHRISVMRLGVSGEVADAEQRVGQNETGQHSPLSTAAPFDGCILSDVFTSASPTGCPHVDDAPALPATSSHGNGIAVVIANTAFQAQASTAVSCPTAPTGSPGYKIPYVELPLLKPIHSSHEISRRPCFMCCHRARTGHQHRCPGAELLGVPGPVDHCRGRQRELHTIEH